MSIIILKKRKRPPRLKPLEWIRKIHVVRSGQKWIVGKWIADGGNYQIIQRAKTDEFQLIMGKDNESVYFSAFGSLAVEILMNAAEQYHQGEVAFPEILEL